MGTLRLMARWTQLLRTRGAIRITLLATVSNATLSYLDRVSYTTAVTLPSGGA